MTSLASVINVNFFRKTFKVFYEVVQKTDDIRFFFLNVLRFCFLLLNREEQLIELLKKNYYQHYYCQITVVNFAPSSLKMFDLSLFSKRARNLLAAHFADLSSVHINPVYCQTHQRIICSSVVRAVDRESEFLSQFRSQGHSSLRNPFYLSFTLYGNEALGPRLYGTCVFLRFPLTLPLLRHE